MTRLQALCIGPAIDLESADTGMVHSVFAHSVNFVVRGELWTLLAEDRDDLPFGIRVAARGFDALRLARGERMELRALVDFRAAKRWSPAQHGACVPGLHERLQVVSSEAGERAWFGSSKLAHDVVTALDDSRSISHALASAVGHGPGATPSGDDVIVGIFAVLRAPGAGARGAASAHALQRRLPALLPTTCDISAHLLRQASDGLFSRAVHELIGTIASQPDPAQARKAVRRVLAVGASSGADLCTGVLAAAPRFLLRHEKAAA